MNQLASIWCAALAALSLPAQAAAPTTSPLSLGDLAARPIASDPVLSPDGRRIAASGKRGEQRFLAIIDTAKPEGPWIEEPLGQSYLSDAQWVGNDRLLLKLYSKISFFSFELPLMRLVALDIAKRKVTPLDPGSRGMLEADILHVDKAGTWALVASQDSLFNYPSVKRVDLISGEATAVEKAREHVWSWFADPSGVVRGGLAYKDRRWTLWYRDTAGEPLRPIRGKLRSDDTAVDSILFGPHGRGSGIIVTNERNGRFGAYQFSFHTGEVGAPIFEHAEVDVTEVRLQQDRNAIRAVLYEDDRFRTKWFDAEMEKIQARLDKALPDRVNQVIDISQDDNRILVKSAAANDPETYFLMDRKARTMSPVLDPYDRIDPARLTPVRWERYHARDGLPIRAYLTVPKRGDGKPHPLIVMPHGGPFHRDTWEYDSFVQYLASRGYVVLQPQFRGSTGFGRGLVESGYGQFGTKMQDDLDDGVDWLVRSGQVDPKRVCIFGASYGGYAALWGGIRNPERYRCVVSFAGVTDLPAQLKFDRKSFAATRYFKQWRNKVSGEGKADLRAVSPINFADRLKVPVFIAHGEQDATVDVQQARRMVAALTKAKADVTSAFYKKSGHGFSDSTEMEDFLRKLEAFLTKYNPPNS